MASELYTTNIQCSDNAKEKFADLKERTGKRVKQRITANMLIALLHKNADKIIPMISKEL